MTTPVPDRMYLCITFHDRTALRVQAYLTEAERAAFTDGYQRGAGAYAGDDTWVMQFPEEADRHEDPVAYKAACDLFNEWYSDEASDHAALLDELMAQRLAALPDPDALCATADALLAKHAWDAVPSDGATNTDHYLVQSYGNTKPGHIHLFVDDVCACGATDD